MKIKRTYYHGENFLPCMLEIDQQLSLMLGRKIISHALTIARVTFPAISVSIMRKRYKEWVEQDRPDTYVYTDQRHFKTSQKALTEQDELLIVEQILTMNRNHQQVTFSTVHTLAMNQLSIVNEMNENISFCLKL